MASDLPVDLLEEIFLHLDDAADLARASATCASFRRVISDGRFLRRLSSLHRRPVLGLLLHDRHYETGLFCPAQSPRRRRSAADGFAKAADFTFSFLPDPSRWRVCDARDGRVLLTPSRAYCHMFEHLVVYDPLHRRHVQIPTIPGELLLSANKQDGNKEAMMSDDPFLAPSIADDDKTGFRVMCTALSKTKVVAFIFSSASGQWQCAASFSDPSYVWTTLPWRWSRQCVHSCVCWAHEAANAMLVLDTREMKFSLVDFPRKSIRKFKMAVEAAGDGNKLGLLVLSNRRRRSRCQTLDLYSKAWPWQGRSIQEQEWQHDSSVVPVRGFQLKLAGEAEGYVLLRGVPAKQFKLWIDRRTGTKKPEAHYFTMELKTLLVQKLRVFEEFDSRVKSLHKLPTTVFAAKCMKL